MQRRPPPCCNWLCGRGRERGTSCCWSVSYAAQHSVTKELQQSPRSELACLAAGPPGAASLRRARVPRAALSLQGPAQGERTGEKLERHSVRVLLHSVCGHSRYPSRAPPHMPGVPQVGYGLAGDLGALAAALGGVCAVEPAIDLASLHRTLAVKGLASLPPVRRSMQPLSAAHQPCRSAARSRAQRPLCPRAGPACCRAPRSGPASFEAACRARRMLSLRTRCRPRAQAGERGLAGLVHAQLGAPLDKRLQCSAWAARPLTAAQARLHAPALAAAAPRRRPGARR